MRDCHSREMKIKRKFWMEFRIWARKKNLFPNFEKKNQKKFSAKKLQNNKKNKKKTD